MSNYGVRNLLPGPSTICRLHKRNHITFTYTASWLREEKRAVICKRPTESGRDEIETIDAFKRRLHLHLCPMFPDGYLSSPLKRSITRFLFPAVRNLPAGEGIQAV